MMRFKDIDSERDELDRCRRYLANDLVNAANNTSRTVQLKEMLSVPVNPDSVSENGKNGLCRAAFEGYKSHVRLLLEAGAQTNTVEEVRNAMEPFADILNRVLKGSDKEG